MSDRTLRVLGWRLPASPGPSVEPVGESVAILEGNVECLEGVPELPGLECLLELAALDLAARRLREVLDRQRDDVGRARPEAHGDPRPNRPDQLDHVLG